MKFIITAAIILTLNGFLNAQQAKLLGEDAPETRAQAGAKALTAVSAQSGEESAVAGAAAAVKPIEAKKEAVKPAAALTPAAAPGPETPKPASRPSGPGGGFLVGKKHSVAGGDTLWALSRKYYGDPFKWGRIYNANTDTLKNPDRIYPADELVIPDITEEIKPETAPAAARQAQAPPASPPAPDAEPDETGTTAAEAPAPAVKNAGKAEQEPAGEQHQTPDLADLSEDMPQDMKEWRSEVKIVPDNWTEAGVITAKESEEGGDSLAVSGEVVLIRVARPSAFRPGDTLTSYMKGASAFDKKGRRLGREILKTGILEVISVSGDIVKARVLDASTSINRGQVINK